MDTNNIIITWTDILKQTGKFSSFEGRSSVTPDGESNYPDVHITTQDYPLVKDYIKEASYSLSSMLGTLIDSVSVIGETTVISLDVDTKRVVTSQLKSMAQEAISCYVVSKWLEERKSRRYESYLAIFKEMVTSIIRALSFKKRPTLSDLDELVDDPVDDPTDERDDDPTDDFDDNE